MDHSTSTDYPELDVSKLHALPSEQQDLYLLTFASDLTRHVATLDADGASAHQIYVKKELFKVVNLSSPSTTRVIRNNLGQCFAGIFGKGDRKLLFESVNELLGIINSGKADKDVKIKHTAIHCLGSVFEAAGDSVISISTLACTTLLRQLKPSQNHAGLRATIIKALGKIVKGIGASTDEAVVRDIWRQARSAASDKSYLVQANACWCTAQLLLYTDYINNSSDFDKLQSMIWKTMESPSSVVRRAAASCLGAVLVKSYSATPQAVALSKKQKKSKKRPSDEDGAEDQVERASSPAPQKSITSLSFSLLEILRLLSAQYCRGGTSNRVRAAIALCYNHVFRGLDEAVIETQYMTIVRHFLEDILGSPAILRNRYRLLITRKFIRMNLSDVIGRKLLGESGQLSAVKTLVNSILKDYPQSDVKERPEPTKEALVISLDLITSLIGGLGSATSSLAELCREGILQVLPHASSTVQIHASKTLQALVLACPQQLLPAVTICMNSVNREVGLLNGPRRAPRKCLGFAYGLAAALSTSSTQPLYGSVEVYSRVLSQATSILKSSSSSDLRISSAQIQVAWILIGGLMSLGPNFTKIHLSQMLMLWKNALPKPLSKDNIGNRGLLELSFLALVRECALGSICAFLTFNGRLLTMDVSKRLATMLQNTVMFLNSLPNKKMHDDTDKQLSPPLQLYDYDLMVRRRVFGCYRQLVSLSPQSSQESLLQSSILSLAASSFTEPLVVSTGSLSAAIASSLATPEGIWEVGDNSAFGMTGLVSGLDVKSGLATLSGDQRHWLIQRGFEALLDQIISSPTCNDLEHDSVHLYTDMADAAPDPLATGVVNDAIRLFAISLPLQASKIQEGILEQVSTMLSSTSQQSSAKYVAVCVNVATALYFALQVGSKETMYASGNLKTIEIEKAMQELLHIFIVHPDPSLRNLGAEALGRLCKSSGSEFTSREVNYLIELIVSNREPHVRAGCATALGCIHSELGGMAAGYHLKNIVGVITSLASDPHPTVHFWALDALCKVADSAGLAFSPFVSSILGMLAQLYVFESHSEETASFASSNMEVDLPTGAVIARCIDSMINALGPDLQDQSKTRNMILTLTYQFQMEHTSLITTESLRCLEHLSMYAPGHISFNPYVRQLHAKMMSDEPDVCEAALNGLYNAMRKGAEEVIRSADPTLEDQLWLTLHEMYGHGIIRNIVHDWVEQSGLQSIASWIKRIQKVLLMIRPVKTATAPVSTTKTNGGVDLEDEEVAGFNAVSKAEKDGSADNTNTSQELLRWQVRYTAMSCLNEILAKVGEEVINREESTVVASLQPCIADIVRIAFSASTAEVIEMRVCGIQIIGHVLQIFGRIPDPDFPEVTLLEQYQAQISSALTPAFAVDSSPVLAAEAVGVCASFISTGIVTDVERMGRILKLLVAALEDFSKDSESASIGELRSLSSNAQIMVKLAVFSAWAELQIASQEHIYLDDVVRPHLLKLTPLWLVSLREYARLKFEPDVSNVAAPGALAGGLDTIYAALNRETLLKFYQSAWLRFVDAIASLIDEDSDFVFDALDGKEDIDRANGAAKSDQDISYRDEPVAFFFVLFGIAFEALVRNSSNQASGTSQRTLEILQAMRKILSPSVTGLAIYQDSIFSEAMDLFDRLVLTETLEIQAVVVDIARNLCISHPAARRNQETTENEEDLSDDIDQLFELTRIPVLVISNHVPNVSEHVTAVRTRLTEESVNLIVLALNALVDAAEVFPAIIKSDLHACILHIFSTILSTGICQESLVPQALPVFRRFVAGLVRNPQQETTGQLRNALARFIVVLKHAQKRESEASLPCEKNTLLASTILLTSSAKILLPSDPLITRFVDELAEGLDNRSTTKVAAGLSRSLLLLPVNASNESEAKVESDIAAHLFPKLIDFVANPSEIEGTEESRPAIAQALVAFSVGLPPEKRALALKVVVPSLLKRAATEGKSTWGDASVCLMELAGKAQDAFKASLGQMSGEQKAFVEDVIRQGGVAARATGDRTNGKGLEAQEKQPTIALKMNF